MGMMPARIKPVINGETQIIQIEFNKGRFEVDGVAKIFGESIRLELESAAQKSGQEGQNSVIRREDVRRDDVETDEDGLTVVET